MVKLEMQEITLAYGDKKVVGDVTFQVMPTKETAAAVISVAAARRVTLIFSTFIPSC